MNVTTGGKELVHTINFLAVGLGETVISFGDSPETLRFVLNFVESEGGKEDIAWDAIDPKTLKITLTNWNNPLGTTLIHPVEIGNYRNRRLFILFLITKAGKTGELRSVTFSVYLGEKVDDGQD